MQETQSHGFDRWMGKIPGGGHDSPSQYSCLENPTEAWRTTDHRVTKSRTRLSMYTCNHFQRFPLVSSSGKGIFWNNSKFQHSLNILQAVKNMCCYHQFWGLQTLSVREEESLACSLLPSKYGCAPIKQLMNTEIWISCKFQVLWTFKNHLKL